MSIFQAAWRVRRRAACDLGRRLGHPVLDHLLLGEGGPVGVARHRSLAHHVERPLTLAQPAHGVMDAPRAQALLRQVEALADARLTAHHVLDRDAHLLVEDLGVAAGLARPMGGVAHGGDVPHDVDPGGVDGHHEHGAALVGVDVRVGHGHHDEEVGHRGIGGEPLVAVDDPLLAVAHRGGGQQRGVGSGPGLGHREGAAELAVEQGLHPLLLLLLGPAHRQQFGVARVGCVVAEDRGRVDAAPEDLVHEPELHLTEPTPAELGLEMGGPQPLTPDLVLHRVGDAAERVHVQLERLERLDLVAHEGTHPVQLRFELRLRAEIPGHVGSPVRLDGVGPP